MTSVISILMEPMNEADPARFEASARVLRDELSIVDVDRVRFAENSHDVLGSKGHVAEWAQLLVEIGSSGAVLPVLVGAVQDWLSRASEVHKVKLTINGDTLEMTTLSSEERNRLITAYISRHTVNHGRQASSSPDRD